MERPKKASAKADTNSADVVAWFAVMENARQHSDFDRAAHARRELAKRGVVVRYTDMAPAGKVRMLNV